MKPIRATAQPHPSPGGPPVHLFRNYTRLMGAVYGVILLGLMSFFAVQLQDRFASEVELIESNVKRHSQFVEYVIGRSLDQLDDLRMLADDEDDIAARVTVPGRPLPHWPGFSVQLEGAERSFSLETPIDFDRTGNLVGNGSLEGRSPEFYGDMEQALLINAGLRSLIFTLPNAAKARFLATEQFLLVSPWRPARDIAFSSDAYLDPVWRLGSTEINPDREKQWAPTYFGGKDVGLLVPVLVPLYREQRLVGVLAIDTSLDYLNRLYSDFSYPSGSLMLVDAYRQVLAHPPSYANPLAIDKPLPLADVLPPALQPRDLAQLPMDTHRIVNGYVVISHHFVGAPWTQFFLVPEKDIWLRVISDQSVSILATLMGLVVAMAATYIVTSLQFVAPVTRLLRQLAAEVHFKPSAIPWTPTSWRPWFDALAQAFKESMHRTGLQKERDAAARLQQSMLPPGWPHHPKYGLWGMLRPGKEGGGNFHDHFVAGASLQGWVVADVRGSAMGPGLLGMRTQTLVRVLAIHSTQDVGTVVETANKELRPRNDASASVALVCLMFDPDTGVLRYCNAGLPAPLRIGTSGRVTMLPVVGGMALGMQAVGPYPAGELTLQPGDTVVVCSEGVIHARNPAHEVFGHDRLADLLREHPCQSARETVERVVAAVRDFSGGIELADDLTCLALVYRPEVTP